MSDDPTRGFAELPDGRRLGYLAVGPPDGRLVLYMHGAIGSPQSVASELRPVVRDLRVRYVMAARPGFGASDPAPGRTLRDFAHDAAALASVLGHGRFTVVGVSAGGPYALACAHELPDRVTAAAVVSCTSPRVRSCAGLPPAARAALRAVRARPRTCAHLGDALVGVARRRPQLVARVMRAAAAPADRAALARSEAGELAAARFLAAAGGGIAGMIDDYLVCARPWGFEPRDVDVPVHVWHGLHDTIVPAGEAIRLAADLPRARLELDRDAGHFFYTRRLGAILGALVGGPEPRPRPRTALAATPRS